VAHAEGVVKLVWHSNVPWAPTGYGMQTALFAPRLRDLGHDVALSATWGLGGARLNWEGMKVYPCDDAWGRRTLGPVAAHHANGEPVLIITLADVWPLEGKVFEEMPVGAWVPVDHDPLPPKVYGFFERTGARPIAMSRFGERMLRDAGLNPLYVPHGIDTRVYRPTADREEARRQLGIPEDAFVVGMVAANKGSAPPRKAFPQVFMAFAMLAKQHEDAVLYLHAEMHGAYDGINLIELAQKLDIPPDRLKFTNPAYMELGVDPSRVASIYSMMDVLAHPSYGEGFGVPIIESQACGTPVIVNDWTAMPELCGSGWIVDGDPYYDASQGSFFKSPGVEDVYRAMEMAYDRRGDQSVRARAREFALGYDADLVTETYWRPVLDELDPTPAAGAAVTAPEVFTRKPNRAERRALKKAA
jgi:glycosyltransferase involved in cell wall biosynthesis